jgi:hemerythrin superfamily protein
VACPSDISDGGHAQRGFYSNPKEEGIMHKQFFEMLQKDHEEVKSLLEQLEKTSDGAVKKAEDLFGKLKKELLPHMRAEESEFYPVLKEKKDARQNVMESLEEHHVTELIFNELDKMSRDAENWGAKLSVLKELIEHHVEEEEDQIFEDAEQYVDEAHMEKIVKAFEKEKERVKANL